MAEFEVTSHMIEVGAKVLLNSGYLCNKIDPQLGRELMQDIAAAMFSARPRMTKAEALQRRDEFVRSIAGQ